MAGVKGRSGGKRIGAGRKKKPAHLRGIDGGASHSTAATRDANQPAPVVPAARDQVRVPDGIHGDDLVTWETLAPLALEQRTLTPATAFAFGMLCRNIGLMNKMYSSEACMGADHRDLIKQVNVGLLSFMLRPNGEPMIEAPADQKPESKLARFRAVK